MRHIVISGASRGLGAALAQRFAAPGTRLFLTARSAEALAKVAALCRDAGAEVEILACDIRDQASLAPALLAFDDAAPVDLIIANAGTSSGSSLEDVPEAYDAAITQIEVNLIGAMALVGPLLPRLRGRGQGQIAVIASLAGLRGLPDSPAYSASKAGLIAWGEALRSLEEAAARIAAGIRARKSSVFFPWPLAFALRLLVLLPAGLSDRAVRLLRFRVAPPEGEG
jgi:short-subunit dehydrogenase